MLKLCVKNIIYDDCKVDILFYLCFQYFLPLIGAEMIVSSLTTFRIQRKADTDNEINLIESIYFLRSLSYQLSYTKCE